MGGAHSPEEGRRDSLIEAVAPGAKREPDRAKLNYAKREPDRAKPQLMVSLAKRCAVLTTPAAPLRCLRGILLWRSHPSSARRGILRDHNYHFLFVARPSYLG